MKSIRNITELTFPFFLKEELSSSHILYRFPSPSPHLCSISHRTFQVVLFTAACQPALPHTYPRSWYSVLSKLDWSLDPNEHLSLHYCRPLQVGSIPQQRCRSCKLRFSCRPCLNQASFQTNARLNTVSGNSHHNLEVGSDTVG